MKLGIHFYFILNKFFLRGNPKWIYSCIAGLLIDTLVCDSLALLILKLRPISFIFLKMRGFLN